MFVESWTRVFPVLSRTRPATRSLDLIYRTARFGEPACSTGHRSTLHPNQSETRRFFCAQAADNSSRIGQSLRPQSKDGYSKLPRVFVGQLEEQPARLSSLDELLELGDSDDPTREFRCRENAILSLSPEQSHYLTSVLRIGKKRKASQQLRVFDGSGTEWLAEVVESEEGGKGHQRKNKSTVTVQCLHSIPPSSNARKRKHSIWLCASPPKKKDRLRWMIEKTVELGVSGFFFVDSDYGEAPEKASSSFDKLQAYSVEAAEQCERKYLPSFVTISRNEESSHENILTEERRSSRSIERVQLQDFLDLATSQLSEQIHLLICRERSNSLPIWNALTEVLAEDNSEEEFQRKAVILMVGPEGGWSPDEELRMDALEMTNSGFIRNISLGSTILRAETAALTAVAACNLHDDTTR